MLGTATVAAMTKSGGMFLWPLPITDPSMTRWNISKNEQIWESFSVDGPAKQQIK